MTIARDVETVATAYTSTGTQTTSHAASASARGAVVLIDQNGTTADEVSGVTYDGVAMTRLRFDNGDSTEAGAVYIYWLDGIATGTKNVAMTTTAATNKQLVVGTMTVAAGKGVAVAGSNTGTSASVANPSWTITGLTASIALSAYLVIHSGLQTMTTTPTSPWTSISNTDLGSQGRGFARQDVASSGTTLACGWTAATADDFVGSAVAFIENSAYANAPADSVGITDSATSTEDVVRTFDDPTGVTDSATQVIAAVRTFDDPTGVTDSATGVTDFVQTIADSVGVTDSATAEGIAAPGLVGQATGNVFSTSKVQSYTSTAGNFLVLCVTHQGGLLTSITDSTGGTNTWIEARDAEVSNSAAGQGRVGIWYCANAAAITSVTATSAFNSTLILNISEWTGVATTDVIRSVNSSFASGGSTTQAATAVSGLHTDDLVIGVFGYFPNSGSIRADTIDSPYTSLTGGNQSTTFEAGAYHVATTASEGPSWVLSPGCSNRGAVTVAFRALGSPIDFAKTPTEAVGVTDSATDVVDAVRAPADSVGATDSATQVIDAVRTQADSVGVTDTATGATDFVQTISDSVGITDGGSQTIDIAQTITDPVGVTDSATDVVDAVRTLDDPTGITDSATQVIDAVRTLTDAVGVTDSATDVVDAVRTQTDAVGATDTASGYTDFARTSTEAVGVTDSATQVIDYVTSVTDSVGITDSTAFNEGRLPVDAVGVTDSVITVQDYVASPSDSISVADDVTSSLSGVGSADLTDTVGITDSVTAVLDAVRTIVDAVDVTDIATGVGGLLVTVPDSVGVTDDATFIQEVIRLLDEAVGITDSVTVVQEFGRTLDDPVGISDTASDDLVAGGETYTANPADDVQITDDTAFLIDADRLQTELVGITDAVYAVIGGSPFGLWTGAVETPLSITLWDGNTEGGITYAGIAT